MNIASIEWPENKEDAIKLFLQFQVDVLKMLDINFEGYNSDPIEIAEFYIQDKISQVAYSENLNFWWSVINSNNTIRDFQNKDVLMARIGISLLSAKEEMIPEFGEYLSWFFELIESLGFSLKEPIELMKRHFSFYQS